MQAAVCEHLLNEWGAVAEVRQTSAIMKASFGDLTAIYDHVLSALQQAPPLPQHPRKFASVGESDIKKILTSAINSIYGGSCTLEFL
jgi:hypothetical protein